MERIAKKIITAIFLFFSSVAFSLSSASGGYQPSKELLSRLEEDNLQEVTFVFPKQKTDPTFTERFVFKEGLLGYGTCHYEDAPAYSAEKHLNDYANRILLDDSSFETIKDVITIRAGELPTYSLGGARYRKSLMLSEEVAKTLISEEYPTYESMLGKLFYVSPYRHELSLIDISNLYDEDIPSIWRELNPYKANEIGYTPTLAETALVSNIISGIYSSSFLPSKISIGRLAPREMDVSLTNRINMTGVYVSKTIHSDKMERVASLFFGEEAPTFSLDSISYQNQLNGVEFFKEKAKNMHQVQVVSAICSALLLSLTLLVWGYLLLRGALKAGEGRKVYFEPKLALLTYGSASLLGFLFYFLFAATLGGSFLYYFSLLPMLLSLFLPLAISGVLLLLERHLSKIY